MTVRSRKRLAAAAAGRVVFGLLSLAHRRINGGPPYVGSPSFHRALIRAARRLGMVAYIFKVDDIDWDEGKVEGWTYGDGSWRRGRFPLPDVVYNRILGRATESRVAADDDFKRLERKVGPNFFNPRYFDKWRVYRWLLAQPESKTYVPETHPDATQHLERMLRRYGSVYIKPRNGMAGFGIVRVDRQGSRRFVSYRFGDRNVRRALVSRSALRKVRSLTDGRRCVIQQGLDLPTYKGHRFDIRAMVQRDGSGQWRVGCLVGKLAAHGSVTTHIRTGGSVRSIDEVLRHVFGDRAVAVREDLERLAVLVPEVIERLSRRTFGEMGLDLGVDRSGRVWLIEANAKPGRTVFAGRMQLYHQWVRHIAEFALYLGSGQARSEATA